MGPVIMYGRRFLDLRRLIRFYQEGEVKLPERIFVTGTDTGVGKTVVSAMLVVGLKSHYWKPIQSGTIGGTDTDWVKQVTKLPDHRFIHEAYRLTEPLSPHAAARLDGITVSIERLVVPDLAPLVIEGAGGIMVPLNHHQFMLDLIKHLQLPVIVVARSGLGTINHTVLTVEKLRSNDLEVLGVVMNGTPDRSNREAIERYGRVKVLAEIPLIDSISHAKLQAIFDHQFGAVPV